MKIYPMPLEIKAGCLLYSFAAVLETEPEDLIKELDHDGMEKLWPELKEPYCFRGFHIQEMIDLSINHGFSVTEIQAMPSSLPPPSAYMHMMAHNIGPHFCYSLQQVKERFKDHLAGNEAVLYGTTKKGITHAWAWDGERTHDPRSGYGTGLMTDHKIQLAWLLRSNQK